VGDDASETKVIIYKREKKDKYEKKQYDSLKKSNGSFFLSHCQRILLVKINKRIKSMKYR